MLAGGLFLSETKLRTPLGFSRYKRAIFEQWNVPLWCFSSQNPCVKESKSNNTLLTWNNLLHSNIESAWYCIVPGRAVLFICDGPKVTAGQFLQYFDNQSQSANVCHAGSCWVRRVTTDIHHTTWCFHDIIIDSLNYFSQRWFHFLQVGLLCVFVSYSLPACCRFLLSTLQECYTWGREPWIHSHWF